MNGSKGFTGEGAIYNEVGLFEVNITQEVCMVEGNSGLGSINMQVETNEVTFLNSDSNTGPVAGPK